MLDYEIIRPLGKGGMAGVYEGRAILPNALHIPVAIYPRPGNDLFWGRSFAVNSALHSLQVTPRTDRTS